MIFFNTCMYSKQTEVTAAPKQGQKSKSLKHFTQISALKNTKETRSMQTLGEDWKLRQAVRECRCSRLKWPSALIQSLQITSC